ncbi:MAG: hypothetical protein ACI9VS_003180 [Candidatus Binatia bacterium]|jgi:hypothetical protein
MKFEQEQTEMNFSDSNFSVPSVTSCKIVFAFK